MRASRSVARSMARASSRTQNAPLASPSLSTIPCHGAFGVVGGVFEIDESVAWLEGIVDCRAVALAKLAAASIPRCRRLGAAERRARQAGERVSTSRRDRRRRQRSEEGRLLQLIDGVLGRIDELRDRRTRLESLHGGAGVDRNPVGLLLDALGARRTAVADCCRRTGRRRYGSRMPPRCRARGRAAGPPWSTSRCRCGRGCRTSSVSIASAHRAARAPVAQALRGDTQHRLQEYRPRCRAQGPRQAARRSRCAPAPHGGPRPPPGRRLRIQDRRDARSVAGRPIEHAHRVAVPIRCAGSCAPCSNRSGIPATCRWIPGTHCGCSVVGRETAGDEVEGARLGKPLRLPGRARST